MKPFHGRLLFFFFFLIAGGVLANVIWYQPPAEQSAFVKEKNSIKTADQMLPPSDLPKADIQKETVISKKNITLEKKQTLEERQPISVAVRSKNKPLPISSLDERKPSASGNGLKLYRQKIQQKLHLLGLYHGPIDGKESMSLSAAIIDYEMLNDLEPTGLADGVFYKVLNGQKPGIEMMLRNQQGQSYLKKIIAGLQQDLASLGFNPGRTDGLWDIQTQTAIKAFEYANGLSVTGRVRYKLLDLMAKKMNKPGVYHTKSVS